jgi:hypothetical protein
VRRVSRVLAVTGVAAVGIAPAAPIAGAEPTCQGYKDVANHGEHVITDYVLGAVVDQDELAGWPPTGIGEDVGDGRGAAVPGGPGPGWHFTVGAPPGASFCVPQAHSGGRS